MPARTEAEGPTRAKTLQVLIVGLGAIGAPLALALRSVGVLDFILVDPKAHKPENVLTQCDAADVGRAKVKVAREMLRQREARSVLAWQRTVQQLEPGWLGPNAIAIVCGDRLSAVRASHELARTLRIPLFRLNIEPACSLATLSSFDYRPEIIECCALCGYGQEDFAGQENEFSCSPTPERPTGSPRALSGFAATWGALVIQRAMTIAHFPHWNKSLSFFADGPLLEASQLQERPGCIGQHENPGRIMRLNAGPGELSLARLCELAEADPASVVIEGSGQVALGVRCDRCGAETSGSWWIRPARPVLRCRCGGHCHAVPFATLSAFQQAHVGDRWTQRLSALGVPTRARISVSEGDERVHFLLG